MKKKLFGTIGILLAGLVAVSGIACDNDEPASAAEELPSGFEVYQNEEHGFQLYYPGNWEKSYPIGTFVTFNSPDIDEFQENVSVGVASCDDMSLDEYIEASEDELSSVVEDITIADGKYIEVNGRTGYEWILQWTTEETQLKQVLFVENGRCYCLTCSATQDSYGDFSDTFDEIIYSFVIEENEI